MGASESTLSPREIVKLPVDSLKYAPQSVQNYYNNRSKIQLNVTHVELVFGVLSLTVNDDDNSKRVSTYFENTQRYVAEKGKVIHAYFLEFLELVGYLMIIEIYPYVMFPDEFRLVHLSKWIKTSELAKIVHNPQHIDAMCGNDSRSPCTCNMLLKGGMDANKAACQRKECQANGKNYLPYVITQQVCPKEVVNVKCTINLNYKSPSQAGGLCKFNSRCRYA